MMDFSAWESLNFFPERKMIGAFVGSHKAEFFHHDTSGDDAILRDMSHELYDVTSTDDVMFSHPRPIPSFGFSGTCSSMAASNGFPRSLLINTESAKKGTLKSEMHRKLMGEAWVPKTVFSPEDAVTELEWPIIAKVSQSQQAKGVYQFKTPEDMRSEMKKMEEKPDVFSEKVDIANEYRAVLYRRRDSSIYTVYVAERKPMSDKIASLREGLEWMEMPSDGHFAWELLVPSSHTSGIRAMVMKCFEVNPEIKLMAVDFCVDGNGKYWYIECNCMPRMSYYLPVSLYYQAVRDFYGEKTFPADGPGIQRLRQLAEKYTGYTCAIQPTCEVPNFPPSVEGFQLFSPTADR